MDFQFKIDDKAGRLNVEEARDVFDMLVDAGFGDADVYVGYDGNCASTCLYADDIVIYNDGSFVKFGEGYD